MTLMQIGTPGLPKRRQPSPECHLRPHAPHGPAARPPATARRLAALLLFMPPFGWPRGLGPEAVPGKIRDKHLTRPLPSILISRKHKGVLFPARAGAGPPSHEKKANH